MSPSVVGHGVAAALLAEEWLVLRHGVVLSSNSAVSQRRDLVRWGEAVRTVRGDPVADGRWDDLGAAWSSVPVSALSDEVCVAALALCAEMFSPSTVARMVGTFRPWCAWLVAAGHLGSDPSRSPLFRPPPVDRNDDPAALTVAQVVALSDAAGRPAEPGVRSTWPVRDVAVVAVLAGTGVRASELVALQRRDALDAPVLHVRRATKSGKRRDVPMPADVVDDLERWDAERLSVCGPAAPDAPLFCAADGAPLTRSRLDHLLRRLAVRAGIAAEIPSGAMAHAFRHHYGVQLAAVRGVPLPVVQRLLGHADPRTTSIYTRASAAELTDALTDAGWL
jgi:site-specific recombinase XerD